MAFPLSSFFTYLGLATALYFLTRLLLFLYAHFLPLTAIPTVSRYKHPTKETWALITGASAGIGYGFAQELTRQGINVVLLSHKKTELEAAQADLLRDHPTAKIRLLVIDAVSASVADVEKAMATLSDLHLTILINNVGGYPLMTHYFKPLTAFSPAEIDGTIAINAGFMARLTALLLPMLAANGPSLIINMSSGAYIGIPWLVMYCATKGFVSSFTAALAREMRAEKLPVDVVALAPGNVRSRGHSVALAWNCPSSRVFAKVALGRIGAGLGAGEMVISPFWAHVVIRKLLDFMPEWAVQAGMMREMREKKRMLEKDK